MVTKHYAWENAVLDEHSARKHKILREYFHQYLKTRCQLPQQEKFRLAVIDAFAGGGKYSCGSFGSPLIFIDELKKTLIRLTLAKDNIQTLECCVFHWIIYVPLHVTSI